MSDRHTFTISNLLNEEVNSTALTYEIGLATLSGLEYINTDEGECDIWFDHDLSPSEESTLSGVVYNHTAEELEISVSREDEELVVIANQSVVTTTSEEWYTVASRNNVYLSGGSYRFAWTYFWKSVTHNTYPHIQTRLRVRPVGTEDDTVIFAQREKPAESSNQALPVSGFSYRYLEAGKYNIIFEFKRVGSYGTVALANSNMEILKASSSQLGSQMDSACEDLIDYQQEVVTTSGVIEVVTSSGVGIEGAEIRYYQSGWQVLGYTDANGQVSAIALSDKTSWRCYYNSRYQALDDQDVLAGIIFQTGKVHSASGNCSQYYAGGWKTFEQDMEILPVSHTFKFSDDFPDTEYDINAGETNYIH